MSNIKNITQIAGKKFQEYQLQRWKQFIIICKLFLISLFPSCQKRLKNTSCFTSQNKGSWWSLLISLPMSLDVKDFVLTSLLMFGKLFLNFLFTSRLGKKAACQGMVPTLRNGGCPYTCWRPIGKPQWWSQGPVQDARVSLFKYMRLCTSYAALGYV